MSVTIITIIIILVIIGSIAILAVSQAREKAKIAKTRKVNSLQDSLRRMQKLLLDLPPQYLSNELRLVVLHREMEILQELKLLNADLTIDEKISSTQDYIQLIQDNKFKATPTPITTEAQGKEARQLLTTLVKFIETQRQRKRIDTSTAKKYILHTNYLICQSKADFYKDKAISAEKNQKYRMSIHHFHNAIAELTKVKENLLAGKTITTYKLKIKELEKIAESQNLALKENASEKENTNEEWDKFLSEDEKWKKKNAYDD